MGAFRAALAVLLLAPTQVARPPTFAVGVENVNLDVLVTRSGRPVGGLDSSVFALTDNGVPQRVEVVGRSTTPIDAILVLDVSSSVRGAGLDALRVGARAFVDALWPTDSVTVLTFARDVCQVARAGAPRAEAHAAIDRLEGWGATTLVDAVYAALLLTDSRRGRPLVIVFSDGADRSSWLTPDQVLWTAKTSDAVVHIVRVDGEQSFLASVAEVSGGRAWSARRPEALRSAFVAALEEFRSRYRLRYEPVGVSRDGWHSLEVRLVGREGKIRARPGYFVPSRDRAR